MRGQGLENAEENCESFRDVVLRCAGTVFCVRRLSGERRNEVVKIAVTQKRRAFEESLQRRSAVAYDENREKRRKVKRVVYLRYNDEQLMSRCVTGILRVYSDKS